MNTQITNQAHLMTAFSEALTRLGRVSAATGDRQMNESGSRPAPLDPTLSRTVAGSTVSTGGTRSITC